MTSFIENVAIAVFSLALIFGAMGAFPKSPITKNVAQGFTNLTNVLGNR